jgi:uncharacterized protein (DUF736 family)
VKPLTVDPGKVVLFKERNKSNEKAPDLRGACNIDGVQYEIGIWERESARGVPYLSGVIKPARNQAASAERPPDDSDIPFGNEPASRVDDADLRRNANATAARASRRW